MQTQNRVNFYISSGELNAMYTLRRSGQVGDRSYDDYICNLSIDPVQAEKKAKEYIARTTANDNGSREVAFTGFEVDHLNPYGEGLKNWQYGVLEDLEVRNIWPWGKHKNVLLKDVPVDYISYIAKGFDLTDIFYAKFNDILTAKLGEEIATHRKAEEERQAAYEAEKKAKHDAAADVPVTEERIQITGKVLSTRVQDGYYGTEYKWLIEATEGFKLWGTVPAALDNEFSELKGKTVSFMCKVQKSDDDPKFGFIKRPTKSKLLAEES